MNFIFFISVKHGSKVVFCANNGKYDIVIILLHIFLHHLQPILTITIKYCTIKTGEYHASIIFLKENMVILQFNDACFRLDDQF